MYLNKVQLIGNITRDPELKALPNGTKVVNIPMATNRTWKDAKGDKQQSTEYHNVIAFGKQAEVIAQYIKKGSSMYIDGRLQTRTWEDKDNRKQYRTEVVIESFQFGPKPTSQSTTTAAKKDIASSGTESQEIDSIEYPDEGINLEDIPF
jgi:single-strand DNA-binding protein